MTEEKWEKIYRNRMKQKNLKYGNKRRKRTERRGEQ